LIQIPVPTDPAQAQNVHALGQPGQGAGPAVVEVQVFNQQPITNAPEKHVKRMATDREVFIPPLSLGRRVQHSQHPRRLAGKGHKAHALTL
jgi:hypothetical protein